MLSGTLVRPRGVLRALRAQRPERQELRRAWWHKRSIITHSGSHTRQQQRGCGWLDAILTTPPPARGCEERCRDRVQAQPPPWRQRPQKRRTKIRQASEPVRQQRLTHPVCTCMQQRSLMRLGMHLRDGSAIRFMGNESFACSRRALSRPSRAR